MNKTYLYVGAMLTVLVAAIVTLVSLAGSDMMTGSAKQTPSVSKAAASPSPSRTPVKPVELTPVPVPTPESIQMTYSCRQGYTTTYDRYTSYEELWALPGGGGKCSTAQSLGEPSELEVQALVAAYGDDYKVDSLKHLYGSCGMTEFSTGWNGSTSQELLGSTLLCPNHPMAADMKATALAGIELHAKSTAEEAASKKATAEGRQVGPGNYLIGVDVQPGTWQTVGEKVTDCYWEVSDAQGNILANNFVSTAPQFILEVPAGPGGFTVQGCAFRQVSP